MAALQRSINLALLWKLVRPRRRALAAPGPGCTCESCVDAWDRHHAAPPSAYPVRRRLVRPY